MSEITITPKNNLSAIDRMIITDAIQKMVDNFSANNLKYLGELADKPGSNEKFDKLKSNPMIKTFL